MPKLITDSIDQGLLADARAGKDQVMEIIALILHHPGQPDRLVTFAPEYGDGEGKRMTRDLMKRMRQLLKPGEQLSLKTYTARFDVVETLIEKGLDYYDKS